MGMFSLMSETTPYPSKAVHAALNPNARVRSVIGTRIRQIDSGLFGSDTTILSEGISHLSKPGSLFPISM